MAACTFEALFKVSIKDPSVARFGTPQIEVVPIERLRTSPRNVRTHPKKQIEQIISSIRRFGWTFPILIDEHGNIIAGHGRLEAAMRTCRFP